jgi:hypothetical protein
MLDMKNRAILALVVLIIGWASSANAQELLPLSFGGWTATRGVQAMAAEQIERVAGNRAAVLREYGVTSAELREYAQGQQAASVTLYRMVDPTAAYGAFTALRDPEMAPLDLGDSASFAAATGDRALFVVGNLVLGITAPGERPTNTALAEIAATLLPRADPRPYPHISSFLPRNGLIAGSERYVLGPRALREASSMVPATGEDWMGFSKSAEAILARYRASSPRQGQEMTLLLTIYPTQQIAADQFSEFNRWMALNLDPAQANGRTVVFGTRSSALVALVFGAGSQEIANTLLGQVQYRSVITWNEPSHELTDPSFPTMIVGVFEGTGLIMLLAVAAGVGFGGFRLIMKTLLPGRVFDRDAQVEILQLGLISKPIDSRDFY